MTSSPSDHASSAETLTVAEAGPAAAAEADEDPIGRSYGRYVGVGLLGRGGMGRVLRAYDPKLRREVALKVLSTTDPVARARIAREAQAMAQLSHPNIVAVYDVELDHDPPFIAMELVEGQNLKEWIAEGPKPWRTVVETFRHAGRGLAAAHAAGLVHRDFKPANVLRGDDGRIRVMDFGIARGVLADPPSESLEHSESRDAGSQPTRSRQLEALTRAGLVQGTPAYMAPEQHTGNEATPLADQYSFCVALWEALCGHRPFSGDLEALARAKAARDVLAAPPGRAIPKHLHKILWRGLSPRPADRFVGMAALLEALEHDPTRRRVALAAVGVVALGTATWAGVRWVHHQRTIEACHEAGAALDDRWNDAVAESIAGRFAASELGYAAAQWERTRPRLDAYAEGWGEARVETCLAEDRTDPAIVDHALACLAERRAAFEAHLDLLREADDDVVRHAVDAATGLPRLKVCRDEAALSTRLAPPSDPEARAAIDGIRRELAIATAFRDMGRTADARTRLEALVTRANEVAWPPVVAEAELAYARVRAHLGERDAAIAMGEHALFEAGASGHDEAAMDAAVFLEYAVGELQENPEPARRYADLAMMFYERSGRGDELLLANALNARGMARRLFAEYDDATADVKRALEIRTRHLGPDHPATSGTRSNLGILYYQQGNFEEALAIHEATVRQLEQRLGKVHPDLLHPYNQVGITNEELGRYDDAFAAYRRALEIARATMPADHPDFVDLYNNIGNVYMDIEDLDSAREYLERALALAEKSFGPDAMPVGRALLNLANIYSMSGDHDEALKADLRALAIMEATFGADHPYAGLVHDNLGVILEALGRDDEALEHWQTGLKIRERALGPDHPDVAMSLTHLGGARADEGDHTAAVKLYERALAIYRAQETPAPLRADVEMALAESQWELGDRHGALELANDARRLLAGVPGGQHLDAPVVEWLREHPPP